MCVLFNLHFKTRSYIYMYTMMMWLNVMNSLSICFHRRFFSHDEEKIACVLLCVCSIFIFILRIFLCSLSFFSYYYPIPILIINSRVINLQNKVHFLNLMRNRDSLETMTKWRNVIKSVYGFFYRLLCATNCLLFVLFLFSFSFLLSSPNTCCCFLFFCCCCCCFSWSWRW